MSEREQRFQRYEKKYLMNQSQYQRFRLVIASFMQEDGYGSHLIGNIYYDNAHYELIRKSMENPLYKEKLRVRAYGVQTKTQPVYVELKKKFDGIVYKRRIQLLGRNVQDFLDQTDLECGDNQIQKEILWFMKRYRPTPRIYVGYERTAFYGRSDEALRLTIDRNIRYRSTDLSLDQGHFGTPLIEPNAALLEIKSPGAIPLWLCHVLSGLEIYPVSFSKVGRSYQAMLLDPHQNKEGEKRYA